MVKSGVNFLAIGTFIEVRAVKVTLLATALLLSGCTQIRMLTYPPDFSYLDSASVKGTMHEMAISLQHLDDLVVRTSREPDDPGYRDSILAELQTLETLATSISTRSGNAMVDRERETLTNHLLIDEHIDEFIGQIMHARLLAEADPPNYYGVGQLSGNCNACHRQR